MRFLCDRFTLVWNVERTTLGRLQVVVTKACSPRFEQDLEPWVSYSGASPYRQTLRRAYPAEFECIGGEHGEHAVIGH